jgi:hypothetical protein
MWLNLVAMCAFLAHAASGVVFAILDVFKVYNKVAQANGEEEAFGKASVAGKDDAWIEGSGVPDAFQPSRRMEHWRHGHGFAIAVDFEKERPYLVCFASGSAKRYALPDLLRAIAWGRKWSWFVVGRTSQVHCEQADPQVHHPDQSDACMGHPFRRHTAASAQGGTLVPLLAGLCASHRNPRSARLAGPADQSYVANPCTAHPSGCEEWMRIAAPACYLYVGANITRAAPHIRCRQDRAQRSQARSCEAPDGSPACLFRSVWPCSVTQRYSVVFQNGHTTILTAHTLLTV